MGAVKRLFINGLCPYKRHSRSKRSKRLKRFEPFKRFERFKPFPTGAASRELGAVSRLPPADLSLPKSKPSFHYL